jgi:hypothetical protein
MRLIKTFDLAVQIVIFLLGIWCIFFPLDSFSIFGAEGWVFYAYFILGGWQVLSYFIHMLKDKNIFLRASRKAYGQTLFWILIVGIFCWLALLLGGSGVTICYMFAMLIIGPIMAIWYMTICYRELKLMSEKALVHLK